MKKLLILSLCILLQVFLSVQAQTDKLYLKDEIKEVQVEEVGANFIKFKYPNEKASYTISRHQVDKIVFASGREEIFESPFKPVNSVEDFENVYLSYLPQDVDGLKSLGQVFSKATGVTTLSSINNVNNRAVRKVKMEAAMLGANVVLIGNTFQRGNQYGNENIPGNATMTSISGTAYTTSPHNYNKETVKNYLENNQYVLFKKDQLNRNAFDKKTSVVEMYDANRNVKLFSFDEVYERDGDLYVKSRNLRSKSGELRILYANEENITLVEQNKNSIYNYFLLSEKEQRIVQMKAVNDRKAQEKR
ncbi:hypothetical protein [Cecembia rubra]|uniref:Uncharacterized protein n=1 Tax=Cecembia rubra TaxID=1485585 RepID=A0A2P8E6K2_9BACT|nr:hypothetical protein [Cecembia rubra]PSL05086.1 hypothetical protein CLV48_104261 [Cecembia rubra]